jgi:hypothetical protein
MPKATVNQNDLLQRGKDDIGMPREVASMESEAISKAMSSPTYGDLGTSVLVSDSSHQS